MVYFCGFGRHKSLLWVALSYERDLHEMMIARNTFFVTREKYARAQEKMSMEHESGEFGLWICVNGKAPPWAQSYNKPDHETFFTFQVS